MRPINLCSTHYFGLLYIAFAHKTDNKYVHEEQLSIWKLVNKWVPSEKNRYEISKIMDDVMEWYRSIIYEENFEEIVFDTARALNNYNWFNANKKKESLNDLKTIALADNKFLKSEKKWLIEIANIWGINTNYSKKLIS